MKKIIAYLLCITSLLQGISVEQSTHNNARRIKEWQDKGVQFIRPDFVLIDEDVQIGSNTVIGCGVHILNGSVIGSNCTIEAFSIIDNCIIEDDAIIYSHSVLQDSTVKNHAKVGPFARMRKKSCVEEHAEIGNFVEMSASTIGEKSKAKHLTYLGCTEVEEKVNIGAGTITCNYDGYTRHNTVFKTGAFIGSNSIIVAPVTVGEGAITGAGSTITKDVPANALALGRQRQINKNGYASKIKELFKKRAKKSNP